MTRRTCWSAHALDQFSELFRAGRKRHRDSPGPSALLLGRNRVFRHAGRVRTSPSREPRPNRLGPESAFPGGVDHRDQRIRLRRLRGRSRHFRFGLDYKSPSAVCVSGRSLRPAASDDLDRPDTVTRRHGGISRAVHDIRRKAIRPNHPLLAADFLVLFLVVHVIMTIRRVRHDPCHDYQGRCKMIHARKLIQETPAAAGLPR